jgi:hypothetical protein
MVAAALVLALAMQLAQAKGTVGQQIQAFAADAQLSSLLYGVQMEGGDYAKASATRDEGLRVLDAGVKKAVEQASTHAALVAAIKKFYVAERSYLENAWSDRDQPAFVVNQNAAQLKQAVDRARSEIDLEVKLAGI